VKAILYGASGGLALALTARLLTDGWDVDLVTRSSRRSAVEAKFAGASTVGRVQILSAGEDYSDCMATQRYDAHIFMQAVFEPNPLVSKTEAAITAEIEAGLTGPIRLTRDLLVRFPAEPGVRVDFCYIGSTSAYAGFRNTSVYCAVKHGLLGFVRAMNDEFAATDARFWLFSMGTMKTDMGARVVGQDPESYLNPEDVAARIAEALASPTNIFEPEVVLRRRTIRLLEG
jgi:NAD(P)-dependent dehydrogenase (short-subunit alcohol dehydrogenase family)